MNHRIFIAINLPEKVKKRLFSFQSQWPELPVRWTKEHNLHITLIFLGYVSDEEIGEVCKVAKEVVSGHQPFSINLKKISYGPRTGPPATREGLASRPKKKATPNDLGRGGKVKRISLS